MCKYVSLHLCVSCAFSLTPFFCLFALSYSGLFLIILSLLLLLLLLAYLFSNEREKV